MTWTPVIGFTLDGSTVGTDFTSGASFAGCDFQACIFTGKSASPPRRYNRKYFANCYLYHCILDENLEFNLNDTGGSDSSPYWYGTPIFACLFDHCIVRNIKKFNGADDVTSASGTFFDTCEFYNTLVIDTRNKWKCTFCQNTQAPYGIFDTAICVTNNTGIGYWCAGTHSVLRSIYIDGEHYDNGHLPSANAGDIQESFFCHASSRFDYVDENAYPLDDAFELFGIGYNNTLTRRFKEYLLAKNLQDKASFGLIDRKTPDALVILAEDGDMNLYSLSATENNQPVRPILATYALASGSPLTNELYVSSSLAANVAAWKTHKKPEHPIEYHIIVNPED